MASNHQIRRFAVDVRCWAPVLAAVVLAGCGNPQAEKFVDGRVTKALHPEAAKVVRQEIDKRFGTPESLVAWMEFGNAIDFGRIAGEVVAHEGALGKHQFAVSFDSKTPLRAEDIKGLGLIWKSGAYARGAQYEAVKADSKRGIEKGQKVDAYFHVGAYKQAQGNTGFLSVNFLLDPAPEAGDKFVLVGHHLRHGRKLFMQHCMHCHGYSGDGNGPTAKYLNPRPRDYRLGKFKFTSTTGPSKASRDDLRRILRNGIPGTYMPSFLMMFDDQGLHDVIEYVRWLALRGEVEYKLGLTLYTEGYSRDGWKPDESESQLAEYVKSFLQGDLQNHVDSIDSSWVAAETANVLVRPKVKRQPATAESIARGRALFLSKKTLCWSCHGVSARGNGYQTTSFQKNSDPLRISDNQPEPGLYDDWGNKIRPRDLTSGIYRGGRRPVDLFRRIAVGIKGTPMAGFRTSLSDREIWDLVNYVLSIPVAKNGTAPAAHSAEPGGVPLSQRD